MEQEPEKPGEAEILAWLQPWIPRPWFSRQAKPDPEDILGWLGFDGDDANELIEGFAKEFGVDLTGFDPWLHYVPDEPPGRRRWHAVDPETGKELPLFPISVRDLVAAAEAGIWNKPVVPYRLVENPFLRDTAAMVHLAGFVIALVVLAALLSSLSR